MQSYKCVEPAKPLMEAAAAKASGGYTYAGVKAGGGGVNWQEMVAFNGLPFLCMQHVLQNLVQHRQCSSRFSIYRPRYIPIASINIDSIHICYIYRSLYLQFALWFRSGQFSFGEPIQCLRLVHCWYICHTC